MFFTKNATSHQEIQKMHVSVTVCSDDQKGMKQGHFCNNRAKPLSIFDTVKNVIVTLTAVKKVCHHHHERQLQRRIPIHITKGREFSNNTEITLFVTLRLQAFLFASSTFCNSAFAEHIMSAKKLSIFIKYN